MNIIQYLKKNYSIVIILIIGLYFIKVIKSQDSWIYDNRIIEWDVKSYYAYLPAAFIYNDLSFEFVYKNENSDFLKNEIWPLRIKETNKLIIKTTMGMSYLYLPAFIIAHNIAKPLGYKANGYSKPYDFAILFQTLFVLLLGLFYLKKLLSLLNISELPILITLIAVSVGTNIYYYTIFEAGMTHVYNFTLITIFIYNTIKWWQNKKLKNLIFLGLLGGVITLIRPTNIIIYFLFAFWGINSMSDLKTRFLYFIKKYYIIPTLITLYIIPWIPQMIFWKIQTGHLLYFSYGESNEHFFFNNPQIFNILFSYWKGWYVYTPTMFIATIGLITLFKQNKGIAIIIAIYLAIMIYILSSWWSWWFGGGYGNRAFIDFYGIMSIPLATLIMYFIKKKYANIILLGIISVFIWYNTFQVEQYLTGALHYWSMSKEMYWEQFLKKERTEHYKEIIMIPDNDAAMNGVFRLVPEKKDTKIEDQAEFEYNDVNDNSIKMLSINNYINTFKNNINYAITNNIDSVDLFNSHKIAKREFNDIFYTNASIFTNNNIDSLGIKLNITGIKNNISDCKLVLTVESANEFKFKKQIDFSNNCNIYETIILPKNTLPTDIVKAYIWQRADNKVSFNILKAKIFFYNFE